MRDVVVIGGGLSGLSACYELEKQSVAYTVIEVKGRFGGAIRTSASGGFLMDASAFFFRPFAGELWLQELGLCDEIIAVGENACIFKNGAEALIRALAGSLRGGRLMRMAVSSLGRARGRFTICLENGMVYDAGAIIVAAPAPYAGRMLRNLMPEAAESLAGLRYDSILRVSLGYRKRDLPAPIAGDPEGAFPFVFATDLPGRVPERDHLLLQVGIRGGAEMPRETIIGGVTRALGLPINPLVSRVDHWPEADPLAWEAQPKLNDMSVIRRALPAGIGLIGSDYLPEPAPDGGIARLGARICAGRAAARAAVAYLAARRPR